MCQSYHPICFFFSDGYQKNPLGFLRKESKQLICAASLSTHFSMGKFFEENSMAFNINNHWTKEVQKALTIPPSSKGNVNKRRKKPTAAFKLFSIKASKWIQYFPDILKLDNNFDNFGTNFEDDVDDEDVDKVEDDDQDEDDDEDKVEDEDESEKQEKEQRLKQEKEKSLLLEKTQIMFKTKKMLKVMLDIANDIEDPFHSKIMQGIPYDIVKGTTCTRFNGTRFYVKKVEHLSEAQLELSTFAYHLAHPSPEEIGISC